MIEIKDMIECISRIKNNYGFIFNDIVFICHILSQTFFHCLANTSNILYQIQLKEKKGQKKL